MTANLFVDSNVIIYSVYANPKTEHAERIITAAMGANALVLSAQVIAEVVVNSTRRTGVHGATAITESLLTGARVQPLDRVSSVLALRIHKRYHYSYWDSQILAAAKLAGARYVLTEDLQDGQVVEGMTIVNPFRAGFDVAELLAECDLA